MRAGRMSPAPRLMDAGLPVVVPARTNGFAGVTSACCGVRPGRMLPRRIVYSPRDDSRKSSLSTPVWELPLHTGVGRILLPPGMLLRGYVENRTTALKWRPRLSQRDVSERGTQMVER